MTKRKILYGYQIRGGALEIIPEEQRVVQMLFALYSAGASYQDISDALNRQGVPYSSEIPLWNKHKIKRILENARYTGKDGYPVMIVWVDAGRIAARCISNANTAAFPFLWIRMRRSKKLPTKCRRMNARRRTLMFPLRRSFG